MIEEDTKELRSQLELQQIINQKMTMEIRRNEGICTTFNDKHSFCYFCLILCI